MKNNKYWFKRKRYGYGFYPTTKEGWILIASYLIFVTLLTIVLGKGLEDGSTYATIAYTSGMAFSTSFVIVLSYKKGPKPRWRWGKKDSDNPELDF